MASYGKEYMREKNRKYYQRHRERLLAEMNQRYHSMTDDERELASQRRRQYYETHVDVDKSRRAKIKAWQIANHDRVIAATKRARERKRLLKYAVEVLALDPYAAWLYDLQRAAL